MGGNTSSSTLSLLANPEAVDGVLNALSDLARSDASEQQFYTGVLKSLVDTVATAGAVWDVTATGLPTLIHGIRSEVVTSCEGEAAARHQSCLRAASREESGHLLPPGGLASGTETPNPFDAPLLIQPLGRQPAGVRAIELLLDGQLSNTDCQRLRRVVAAIAEICQDFERGRRLHELESSHDGVRQFERLTERLHVLGLADASSRIANDGRHFVGCDRVAVASCHGSRVRIRAISGVDSFDRRSPSARLLEQLAARVVVAREPIWSDQLSPDTAPQISELLEAYQDESHARAIGVVPLESHVADSETRNESTGVLVLEQFTEPFEAEQRRKAIMLARQAGIALDNAMRHGAIPLLPLWQALGRLRSVGPFKLARATLVVAVIASCVLALVLVPADFTIEARGTVQPVRVRQIFAPGDGVIQQVDVTHGQLVHGGDVLLQMDDPQLDFELQRVLGEIQTVRQRLSSVAVQRIGSAAARSQSRDRDQLNRMTAEKEELQQRLEGLNAQHEILKQRREQLRIVSPLEGEVVTWDAHNRLHARPVRQGQVLMSVADTSGPWVLELEISEADVMPVHRARAELGEALRVDYILATDSTSSFHGSLRDVAPAARVQQDGRRTVSVRADVRVDRQRVTPGASAIAEIHCGRRAIGYVWLRDLFEAIQSRWAL